MLIVAAVGGPLASTSVVGDDTLIPSGAGLVAVPVVPVQRRAVLPAPGAIHPLQTEPGAVSAQQGLTDERVRHQVVDGRQARARLDGLADLDGGRPVHGVVGAPVTAVPEQCPARRAGLGASGRDGQGQGRQIEEQHDDCRWRLRRAEDRAAASRTGPLREVDRTGLDSEQGLYLGR